VPAFLLGPGHHYRFVPYDPTLPGCGVTIVRIKHRKNRFPFFDGPRFVTYIRAGSSSTAPRLLGLVPAFAIDILIRLAC
jgi:hypothetical protein